MFSACLLRQSTRLFRTTESGPAKQGTQQLQSVNNAADAVIVFIPHHGPLIDGRTGRHAATVAALAWSDTPKEMTYRTQHNTAQHNTHTHTHTQEYCDSSRKTHSTFHNILSVFHFKFHVESAPTRSVSAALRWLRDRAKVESEGLAPLSYDAMADETCQNCTTVA